MYGIEKDEYTNEYYIYKRGDINWNNDQEYYNHKIKTYHRYVYLETKDVYQQEKEKFSLARMYNKEINQRKKQEKELQSMIRRINK